MENVRNFNDNYDVVLKEALSVYTDKSLEFLGINAKVVELLNTENIEVEIHKTLDDQVLRLDTGNGADIEWEAEISQDDLLRFAGYNIALTRKYKIPFKTVIVTRKEVRTKTYIGDSIQFTPTVINLSERDGNAALKDIREKLEKGIPVNLLEVVYAPLYNYIDITYVDVYKTIIELVPKIEPDKQARERLLILSALLGNKFIADDEYRRILEAIKMAFEDNKLFRILKEEGKAEGRAEGRVEADFERARNDAINLLRLGVSVEIVKKGIGLSDRDILDIQHGLAEAVNN